MSAARVAAALPVLLALLALACSQSGPLAGVTRQPVVQATTISASADSLKVVGVMPFYPRPELGRRLEGSELGPEEVALKISDIPRVKPEGRLAAAR